MGYFQTQLPIPNTHQFTSLHPPLGAHTPLVCPTSSPRPESPRSTRPAATCLRDWASPPPPPGARDPANPRARAWRAEPRRRAGLGGEVHLQTKGGRAPAARVGPGCHRRRPSAEDALGPRPQRSLELLQPRRPGQHCHVPATQTREKEPPERDGGQQNPGWNEAGSARAQAATMGLAHTMPAAIVAPSLSHHPQVPPILPAFPIDGTARLRD